MNTAPSKKEQLYDIISKTLDISVDSISDELAAGSIPQWDSLQHVVLISAIESNFGIQIDVDALIEIEDVSDLLDIVENA